MRKSVRGNRQRGRPSRNKGDSVGAYFGDAWSLAKRTASGLNEIRKLINIEEKQLEFSQASVAFDTNGTVFPVSQIVQGLNYTERVGDSLKIQRIEFNYRVFKNASATNSVVRILLVRDLDCQGATPAVADIIANTASGLAPLSPYKFLNRKRFSILYDNMSVVSTSDLAFVDRMAMAHEGHILYLGTAANAASQGKGSLFVVAVSDEATNTPTIQFTNRITFTDD